MRVFGWIIAAGVILMVAVMVFLSVASIFVAIAFPTVRQSRVVASQAASQSVTLDGTQAEMVYVQPVPVQSISLLPVLFLAFCFFAFLSITALALMMRTKGRQSNSNPGETALLQSMHAGLSGMEQRLEALETLILEKKA